MVGERGVMVHISVKRSRRNIKRGEDGDVSLVGGAVLCCAAVGESWRNAIRTTLFILRLEPQ